MLLLLLLVSVSSALFNVRTSPRWRPSWVPPLHETDCTFERVDSYNCLKQYVDINPKDEQITQTEIEEALSVYMPTYLKPLIWWAGVDSVMKECDVDKNGVITPRDWELSSKTCFPIKESQCTVQWFCERAAAAAAAARYHTETKK
jgi:hypothetical protein